VNILALDTSTLAATMALTEDHKVLAESNLPPGRTHSTTLLPEIRRMLKEHTLDVRDVDLFAVGLGPGSFTGLRIGLAAAKGLAWAAGKPLVGVPTLDALARNHPPAQTRICPLLDARKGQVYAALFEPDEAGGWKRTMEEEAFTPDELAALIHEETVFFGEGVRTWEESLSQLLGAFFLRGEDNLDYPRAEAVARLAVHLFYEGTETDPAGIVPRYIRPPDIRAPKVK
jgi:tRNA threonylcarbamoyladenosine biosynthesis protein TsaB